MRNVIYMLLSFLLVGCGSTSAVKFTSETLPERASFLLLDERPVKQKQSYQEIDPSAKEIFFGDDNFNPIGPELLKTTLQKKLNVELSGKTVMLTDFIVNVSVPGVFVDQNALNVGAATVSTVPKPNGNGYVAEPFAGLLVLTIESIRSEKNIYVKVSGKVNDIPFSVDLLESVKGRVTEDNIKSTVLKTLEDVATKIRTIVAVK